MQKMKMLLLCLALVATGLNSETKAQQNLSGEVKYQKVSRHDFSIRDDDGWKKYTAELPKASNYAFYLSFEDNKALYQENPNDQEEFNPGLMRALHAINMSKPPQPNLKQVYYDLNKQQKEETKEFMTRNFIIKSDIEKQAWKVLGEQRKVQGYVCIKAEISIDGKTYTAWFTPQIPLSIGPDMFGGLPGLILAVELNGETLFVASEISMNVAQGDKISKPKNGKKVSPEAFEKIIAEKVQEFEQNKSKGHTGR